MSILYLKDKNLTRRMLKGDERAFNEFFDRYFTGLYRFAKTRLGDDASAEEVAQAALCKAVRKLSTYRGEAALFSWLCTFCRREISDYLRLQQRAPQAVGLIVDRPEVWSTLETMEWAEVEGPDQAFRRRELARWVRVTLDHLPERYGQVLEWKYLEDLSVKEIAERLGIGAKAAESVLTRARTAFREGFSALQSAAAAPAAGNPVGATVIDGKGGLP